MLNRNSTFGYQVLAVRATVTANVAAGGFTPRMGILDRVSTLLRANINDMIDRAEDPEKVVKQLIIDMNNQLLQVKTQVAASIADEKLLYQRYQDNESICHANPSTFAQDMLREASRRRHHA